MRKSIFYLVLIFLGFSCNNETKNQKLIGEAEKIIRTDPDSASCILAKIRNTKLLNEYDKADFYRLTALSHRLTGKAMVDDSLILFSLEYYKNNKIYDYLNETYMLAAMYYHWNNNEYQYDALLNEGLNYSLEINDSINSAKFYYLSGEVKNKNRNYSGAIDDYKRVVEFDKSAVKDLSYLIGLAYANMNVKDSTEVYMNRCISLSVDSGDTISALHFLRNYSDILYSQTDYHKALQLIRHSLSYDIKPSSNLYTTASGLYLMLNKVDSAQLFLDKAKEILFQDNGGNLITNYNSVMSLQSVLDYTGGKSIERTEIGRFNDSIWQDSKKKSDIVEEKIRTKNRLEQENLIMIINEQRTQMLFIIILSLSVICLISGFIYLRNKKLKLEDLEEKSIILQDLLSDTTKEGSILVREDFFKKVLLQQLGLIRMIATSPTSQNQELLKQISQIANENIATDALLVWEDLYNTIDSVYDNFYTKIRNKYGEILIEKEIQLCCLLCAEFSTKEISVVIQQSVRTIYQRKTTIRQKLQMNEKDDIISFLMSEENAGVEVL